MPGMVGHNPFDPDSRLHKVEKIFKLFDANGDGYLNRQEMAALVMGVNPRVKFTDAQINAILNEVFRSYGEFIAGDKGLRQDGLLRTYNDGAGDIDRDFEALGLTLDDEEQHNIEDGDGEVDDPPPPPPPNPVAATISVDAGDHDDDHDDSSEGEQQEDHPARSSPCLLPHRSPSVTPPRRKASNASSDPWSKSKKAMAGPWPPSWTASPNNGIVYADTWHIVEDLDTLVRRAEAKIGPRRLSDARKSALLTATDLSSFQRCLAELCERADCSRTQDEAFDAHMAMGRTLFDHAFFDEALARFKRAIELRPTDVRPYFRSGNSLCSTARFHDAVESYSLALEAAHSNGPLWCALLPQIHVNLGIALEGQGMLLGACEHYREAAILSPAHYRALKLLGSALLGVGEYRAAEKALREAISIKPDYADAHCDLGSVLHAAGDSDKAVAEFHAAIQLQPSHTDALYNLGGCLRDSGSFSLAAEAYSSVIALDPTHWQAHLNKAVSLLGMADVEHAVESMKQAFKLTNRVEIFDEMKHLRYLQRNPGELNILIHSSDGGGGDKLQQQQDHSPVIQCAPLQQSAIPLVDHSRFLRSSAKTTPSLLMRCALEMRAFQRHTRFNRCNVSLLTQEILDDPKLPLSQQSTTSSYRSMRKADVEKLVRNKLLPFLSPQTFQGTIKSLNERALAILDKKGSGRVDPGMFLAVLAPICSGALERRKRVAFDSLVWRSRTSSKKLGAEISRADAKAYFKKLKSVYMPLHARPTDDQLWEVRGEDDNTTLSFPEFLDMFEESSDLSFSNILETLVRLESRDRSRHNGINCSVCSYEIVGPRFREVSANFNLCSVCYSEGKVPPDMLHEEYFCFKEYGSEADAIKEKLLLFGSKVPKFA
ncbi:uncharacterized TPR repeat-containing protein At1g05150 [Selaginella moellendorffii]|uniref:uncharacterized TPR repeat-containing protein At1g05150 n=1 Tax=Selaginella moellendorffii TaxID=88036 RepID=UPI000D1C7911|nr:uncharacterized TPR repeat-containing protein At1g05150 [Selaginella moellendorffii]|eukprot:XP_024517538.1 uncharacterized TPR repeat-containing protein At1g05150 [Selaginella moellendorffii]